MSEIIFKTLEELVGKVRHGDERTAFIVQHRNKDYFALAESEAEAIAAVAEANGYQAGLVPVDLLIQAAISRGQAGAAASAEGQPAEKPGPSILTEPELNALSKAELIQAADDRGIELPSKSTKVEFVKAILSHDNPPAEASETDAEQPEGREPGDESEGGDEAA